MSQFAKTGLVSNCADRFDNSSAVINGLTLVNASPANLYRAIFENEDPAAAVYFQIFDAVQTADVTLGTTVPAFTIKIPTAASAIVDPLDFPLLHFFKGIVIAATTTRLGSTIPTTKPCCNLWFVRG